MITPQLLQQIQIAIAAETTASQTLQAALTAETNATQQVQTALNACVAALNAPQTSTAQLKQFAQSVENQLTANLPIPTAEIQMLVNMILQLP